MADDSFTDIQNNPQLLSQLLALLQGSQQNGGTAPAALPAANQGVSNGSVFQLGPNGMPDAANPGSSPDSSLFDSSGNFVGPVASKLLNGGSMPSYWQGSLPTQGIQAPRNSQSVGGSQYGNASGSDGQTGFVNNPQDYARYQGQVNAAQTGQNTQDLNQLLGGLLKQYQSSQASSAAAAPVAPPLPPPPPNVQSPYTAPSAAQIPGMQSLAQQVQAGTASPTAITAAGGPLTASSGSGLQFPGQYNPVGQSMSTQGVGISAPTVSPLAGLSGAASIPASVMQTYQRANQLQSNGFGPASRSYSPSTQDLGSVDSTANLPLGVGGQNYAQGGLDLPSGADAPALGVGGANYSQGGLDLGAESSGASDGAASVGGGGAAGIGGSVAGGIQAIGDAIQKMYTPIKLNIPPIQPGLQQPKPVVDNPPVMIG
jgi:hypothetical protein